TAICLAPRTGFELGTFRLTPSGVWRGESGVYLANARPVNGVSTVGFRQRLSAFAWVVLDGMGLELAGQETPPGKPAASGNENVGRLTPRANSGLRVPSCAKVRRSCGQSPARI